MTGAAQYKLIVQFQIKLQTRPLRSDDDPVLGPM
jgi:hypothetical protein